MLRATIYMQPMHREIRKAVDLIAQSKIHCLVDEGVKSSNQDMERWHQLTRAGEGPWCDNTGITVPVCWPLYQGAGFLLVTVAGEHCQSIAMAGTQRILENVTYRADV